MEDNDKFLFTRIAYGHKQWTLPGGGVKRNESFKQAALRELYEETGIKLEDMEFFAEYKFQIEYKQDAVQCFYAKVSKPELLPDMLEVAEAQWFSRKDLPQPRRGTADKILTFYDEWKQKQV